MTGIKGRNPSTAKRSLNSLLNFSPLIKCYFITPNFSGCLKIMWSADARVFWARLLLNGERPWEWGWSLCQLFPFILVTRILVSRIKRGWVSSPESEVVATLGTRFQGDRWTNKKAASYFSLEWRLPLAAELSFSLGTNVLFSFLGNWSWHLTNRASPFWAVVPRVR